MLNIAKKKDNIAREGNMQIIQFSNVKANKLLVLFSLVIKDRTRKKKQTKENQLFSIFYIRNWLSQKKIARRMFTIVFRNILTFQNSWRLKLNFRRKSMRKKPKGNSDII